ncbi:probable proton-coupled zinc antiporter SLC30A3 isoform X10 [Macaca nemestrina]|uniref:probable proton-coupled zinc antiporter SLC30A3 isoform X10 n=2 Tax=Macaca TaxID=9539 RepID=UPI0005F4439B|nr:zinc transporter 3 isoform X9 [Macaca nemestrina]XP_028687686.1 zinc transporter 3 isoform X8 [Macaca mulatta]XP_050609784.1 probable proton-coupled zinc antiporter SLC30A3 isoform X7 [Macaca thibetana thibetana]
MRVSSQSHQSPFLRSPNLWRCPSTTATGTPCRRRVSPQRGCMHGSSCMLPVPCALSSWLGRWSTPSFHPGRRVSGTQPGHHDRRSPLAGRCGQHDGQPLLPLAFHPSSHPHHDLWLAPFRMAFVLHQAGPPHSHGSRGAEYAPLEEGPEEPLPLGNTSVRAAFVHVLGDLLQSFGVLAASILIYFKPQYKAADPISTFLFSICALGSTAPTLRDVLRILMEGTPRNVGFEPVRDTLLSVPGVRATHELHLWALTLTYHVASAHLAIDSTADPEAVLAEASSRLYSRFGFSSCTLQVEQYQPEMAQCLRCQEPPQA